MAGTPSNDDTTINDDSQAAWEAANPEAAARHKDRATTTYSLEDVLDMNQDCALADGPAPAVIYHEQPE